MTTNSLVAIALAALCVLSIGVSATTLESSMGTDPDDVIDLDWERLPIGEETAIELNEQIQANGDGGSADATGEVPSDRDQREPQSKPGVGNPDTGNAPDTDGPIDRLQSQQPKPSSLVPELPDPDDTRWLLLALLAALLAVAYRYRDRFGFGPDATDGDQSPPWPPADPATEVDRAWLAMVRRLDVDRPWARTPAEFAAAAADAGMDSQAVEQVTAAFRDVRYGGAAVTDECRERARSALSRLTDEGDSA